MDVDFDDSVWSYNNLEYNSQTEQFEGEAITEEFEGGYAVRVSVSSYEMNDDGDMNYVPSVVLEAPDGSIEYDGFSANDSTNPKTALNNAVSTGEYVYNNYEEWI